MTAGAVLRLKRDHDRPRVHPWIFKGDVADVSDVPPGTAVTVVDASARFVGRGFYNPRPALCCRIITRRDEPLDGFFFRRRLEAALAFRAGPARGLRRTAERRNRGAPRVPRGATSAGGMGGPC